MNWVGKDWYTIEQAQALLNSRAQLELENPAKWLECHLNHAFQKGVQIGMGSSPPSEAVLLPVVEPVEEEAAKIAAHLARNPSEISKLLGRLASNDESTEWPSFEVVEDLAALRRDAGRWRMRAIALVDVLRGVLDRCRHSGGYIGQDGQYQKVMLAAIDEVQEFTAAVDALPDPAP